MSQVLILLLILVSTPVAIAQSYEEEVERKPLLIVPELVGSQLSEAMSILPADVSCKVFRVVDPDNEGRVIRTSPAAHQPLHQGNSIIIFVGEAPSRNFDGPYVKDHLQGESGRPWVVYLVLQLAVLSLLYLAWKLE